MSVRVLSRDRFVTPTPERGSSSRSAARLVAAAMTMLLVSFIVVTRSADALGTRTDSPGRFAPGQVALTDDDAGRTLFDLPAMVPSRVEENCITVSYQGNAYPALIRLSTALTGTLAANLDVKIDEGQGGSFGDCNGFQAGRRLFAGTLAEFGERHGSRRDAITVFKAEGPGDGRTFRFQFVLTDRAPAGDQANATFEWEARA